MAGRGRAVGVLAFALCCFAGLLFLALHGGVDDSLNVVVEKYTPAPVATNDKSDSAVEPTHHVVAPLVISTGARVHDAPQQVHPTHTLEEPDLLPCARQYFEDNYQRSLVETPEGERAGSRIPAAGIDVVYMIHYTPMKKRRAAMTTMLAMHNVYPLWVTGFDKGVLNDTTAQCFHTWRVKDYRGKRKEHRDMTLPSRTKALGPAQRSVVTKHHSALYDMYRTGYAHALVLEDDALLRANFAKRLGEVMREVPPTYDVVMIGGCMKMFAYRRKFNAEQLSKHVYRKREARCAHAFVVSQKGARRLLSSLPFMDAIDFQMTAAMNELEMEVYWVEPWMSVQGPSDECGHDFGVGCQYSVVSKVPREFDARFSNDTEVDKMWDLVPAFRSKR